MSLGAVRGRFAILIFAVALVAGVIPPPAAVPARNLPDTPLKGAAGQESDQAVEAPATPAAAETAVPEDTAPSAAGLEKPRSRLGEKDSMIFGLRSQLAEKDARIGALEGRLDSLGGTVESLEAQVAERDRKLRSQLAELAAKIDAVGALETRLAESDKSLTDLKEQIAQQEAGTAALEERLQEVTQQAGVLDKEREAAERKAASLERNLADNRTALGSLDTQRLILGGLLVLALIGMAALWRRKPAAARAGPLKATLSASPSP